MYKSLEALRIIAAVLVVTAHLAPTTLPLASWFFSGHIFLGSIGVDVFFIISGIVMGLAFQKRTNVCDFHKRTQGFLASRARKIFPLYIIATLIASLIAPFFGRPLPEFDRLILDLLLLPHMTDGRYIDPIIGAGWTLRYEVFFYLAVLVGLLLNRRHFVTIFMIAVAFGFPFAFGYYSTPLILEFLAGYLLAGRLDYLATPGSLPLRLTGLVAAVTLFLIATTGTDFQPNSHELDKISRMYIYFGNTPIDRVLAWGIPSMLLVLSTVSLESHIPRHLAALGKYTYSLYLMQYFSLPLEHKLIARGWPEILALLTTILSLSAITYFSYKFIEKPFSAGGSRKSAFNETSIQK